MRPGKTPYGERSTSADKAVLVDEERVDRVLCAQGLDLSPAPDIPNPYCFILRARIDRLISPV